MQYKLEIEFKEVPKIKPHKVIKGFNRFFRVPIAKGWNKNK